MEFLPYKRLTITTNLAKDEVIRRLRERVGSPKRENFLRVDKNIFSGQLINDKFELSQIIDYGILTYGKSAMIIAGTISENDNTTELTMTLKATNLVIAAAIFMLIGLIVMLVSDDFNWMGLIFVIFPYLVCWFGFNVAAEKVIDDIIKITKGEIK